MNKFKILTALFSLSFFAALSQKSATDSKNLNDYITHNRTIDQVTENEKVILRFNEAEGQGMAWLKDLEFSEGAIEFDSRGRDILQKSFIGVAFHGKDNGNYETIYFRPFNFQSQDPIRKIHAVQYCYEPHFGFQELRQSHKNKFESAIKPPNIQASDWFHVKIEVKNKKIKVFLNESNEPCLEVETLNQNPAGKKIGYWVGNNSNGDFANLKISI